MTEKELKDLQVDFAPLAGQIPANVSINGEIISDKSATVTAKLPDNDTDQPGLQEIKLRRKNGVWVILTVDEEAEKEIKKEVKNYFFALKIETHQREAKEMLIRNDNAQMVYMMQNKGIYADIPTLIGSGFLPEDIQTSESTGYFYKIYLLPDKKVLRRRLNRLFMAKPVNCLSGMKSTAIKILLCIIKTTTESRSTSQKNRKSRET